MFKIVIYKENKGIFSIADDPHLYSSKEQAMKEIKNMGFSDVDNPTTYMKMNPRWKCVFASEKIKFESINGPTQKKVYIFEETRN